MKVLKIYIKKYTKIFYLMYLPIYQIKLEQNTVFCYEPLTYDT